jgi:hypothetical protein
VREAATSTCGQTGKSNHRGGVLYQFMGLKLDGVHLVIVGVLIVNFVNLFRSQLRQASDRIDELEKRLAALGNTRDARA